MECTNKYYDCITHLRLGRGKKQTQNKSMAISGLQCRGRLVDPAGRPLQSLYAKQLAIYIIYASVVEWSKTQTIEVGGPGFESILGNFFVHRIVSCIIG